MSIFRSIALLIAVAMLAMTSGCVELLGQRIAFWHDVQRDTLHILLFYDGVHDSGDDSHGDGDQQLVEFLDSGSILLLDWPFHIDMTALRHDVDQQHLEPAEQELLDMLRNQVEVSSIGHFRDADGRIGGLQHIEIRQASEFLRSINDNISQLLLAEPDDAFGLQASRTMNAMQDAAEQGHQWITLDGQSLRVEVPVHPFEWRTLKAQAMEHVAEAESRTQKLFIQGLSSSVTAYDMTDGRLRLTLGDDATNAPLRFTVRPEDEYEPSLEPIVLEHVPQQLPGLWPVQDADYPIALELYREYAPPEQLVLDTLNAIDADMDRPADEALELVRAYVEQAQDRAHPVPESRDAESTDLAISLWKAWSRRMMQYPLAD